MLSVKLLFICEKALKLSERSLIQVNKSMKLTSDRCV